jgi:type IV secretion system protein VirB6
MFNWVGQQLDGILNTYVLTVVSALMTGIAPIALTAMTLWVGLYGWAVLRHEVSEPLSNFVWKAFKIGLVLAFALQASVYIDNVAGSANALAMGVASTFLPAGVDPAALASPYALLDKFNDDASNQVADIMKEASMFRLDLLLAAAVFSIGSVVFLCIALFVVTLSKLFLTFVLAVGPLFVLCLAWRPTARFFDSWLSMLLNAVVLTWFAFFALGLSAFMGVSMFKAIADGGGFLGGNFNVLGEATRYCVLMVLMAIICFQAPSLASALTGGAAVQQGMQMVQSTLMISRAGAAAGMGAGPGGGMRVGTAGGVVRAGAGMPHAVGRTAGRAVGAAAGAAVGGATALAYAGAGVARVAAYKLAALRGRT